jgi:hypothetical protein
MRLKFEPHVLQATTEINYSEEPDAAPSTMHNILDREEGGIDVKVDIDSCK